MNRNLGRDVHFKPDFCNVSVLVGKCKTKKARLDPFPLFMELWYFWIKVLQVGRPMAW